MRLQMVQHQLVLLPGLDGTGLLFAPLLSVLPPDFTAAVVKYPPNEVLPYSQLLPYIREAIPWDMPYTLVAESFSGPLALQFAAAQPENIRAIVLVASFVTSPLHPLLKWAGSLMPESWMKIPPSESLLRKFLLGDDCPPVLVDSLAQAIQSVRPEVLAHRIRSVLEVDAKAALQACQKPILYLLAGQDKVVGKRGWETITALKPNVTTVALDGPHLLLQRNPREAIAAIEQFLQQLEPKAEP